MSGYLFEPEVDWSRVKAESLAAAREIVAGVQAEVNAALSRIQETGVGPVGTGNAVGETIARYNTQRSLDPAALPNIFSSAEIDKISNQFGADAAKFARGVQQQYGRTTEALTRTATAAEGEATIAEKAREAVTARLAQLELQVEFETQLAARGAEAIELAGEGNALRKQRLAAEAAQTDLLLGGPPRAVAAADSDIFSNLAYSKVAAAERASVVESLALTQGAEIGLPAQQAATAVQKMAADLEQRLAVSKLLLEGDQSTLQLKAQEKVLQEQVNAAYQERLFIAQQNAGVGPVFGPPLPPSEAPPEAPSEGGGAPVAAGGVGSIGRLATGFLTAIAVARVSQGIAGIVKDASLLNKEFDLTKQQFDALGDSAGFEKFKSGMLEIARDTGVSTVEVAQLGREIKGAFSDKSDEFVQQQVKTAAQLIQVTGASKDEINNQLVAISESFGVSFQEIGDKAAGLGQRFGVETKEIVTGLGSVSAVAKEAGLSLNETAAFITTIGVASGRGGAAIAESFGRILPEVSKQSAAIVNLFQQAQAGDEIINKLIRDVAQNKPGQLYLDAVLNADKLNANQQDQFASLFGPRQAFVSLTAFNQRQRLTDELQRPADGDTGKLAEQYTKVAEQLNVQFAKLGQEIEQLGIALLNSGLKDVLVGAVQDVTVLVSLVAKLVGLFESVNSLTHGILGDLVAAATAAKGLEVLGALASARGAAQVAKGGSAGLTGFFGSALGKLTTPIAGLGAEGAEAGGLSGLIAEGGLLGGAAGLLASPLAIGAGVLGLGIAVQKITKDVKSAAEGTREKIASSLDGLDQTSGAYKALQQKVDSEDFDGINGFVASLLGTTKRQVFDQESTKARVKQEGLVGQVQALTPEYIKELNGLDAGTIEISTGRDKLNHPDKFISELVKRLQSGDQDAEVEAKAIFDFLNTRHPEARGILGARVARLSTDAQVGAYTQRDPKTGVEAGVGNLQTLNQEYSGGTITTGEFLQGLKPYADLKKKADELGNQNPDFIAQAAAAEKAGNAAFSKALKESVDLKLKILEASTGSNPQAEFDAYNKLLDDPTFKDPALKFQVAEKLAELGKKLVDEEASMATTAAQKIAILKAGLKASDNYRIIELETEIGSIDPLWSIFIASQLDPITGTADFAHQVAVIAITEGVTAVEAAKKYIEREIAATEAALVAVALSGGNFDITTLTGNIDKLKGALGAVGALPELQKPGEKFGDPEAAAKDQAKQDKDEAKNAALAANDVEKAKAQDDAVRQAQLDVERANIEARYADKNSEKLQAEAAQIKAARSLADAIHNVMTSQIDLAIAVANAAGDTVGAAQDGLKKANDALAYAEAHGAGEGEINALKIGVVNAAANARDVALQKDESDIQFQLDMKKITAGQAIGLYEQLLRLPYLRDQERQDIDRTILGLKEQAGRDYQFNLPTELGLPTLYTARRLDQSLPGGQQYNDNRTITIQVSGVNAQQVVGQIVDELNKPARYGLQPRFY